MNEFKYVRRDVKILYIYILNQNKIWKRIKTPDFKVVSLKPHDHEAGTKANIKFSILCWMETGPWTKSTSGARKTKHFSIICQMFK